MRPIKDYDILIIGELCGLDLIVAEKLARKGLNCCVLRRYNTKYQGNNICSLTDFHTHFKDENVIFYKSGIEFLKIAWKSRLILSFTGSLLGALGKLWLVRHILKLPPVINHPTGSDIMELAVERSLHGILYRQYLKFADLNICINYPHVIKNIFDLKLRNIIFLRYFCHYIGEDNEAGNLNVEFKEGPIVFFHASHIDWKINDPGAHRKSSKGNDRFIKAFARAVKNGLDARCIILDRGPDKEVAKNLISQLYVSDRFLWKPHLSRKELFDQFQKADVIVDQFDTGGFGGISFEAMAMGKPVMIYAQENCQKLLYSELPPVLNCASEEDIFNKIMACRDREYLNRLGDQSKRWVKSNHHMDNDGINQFIFYYTLLTGHRVIDYGWDTSY